jgi:hypothetical protein
MDINNNEIYAIAVVIENNDHKALYGKRNVETVKEYKGFWSIPSMPISKEDFNRALKLGILTDTIRLVPLKFPSSDTLNILIN